MFNTDSNYQLGQQNPIQACPGIHRFRVCGFIYPPFCGYFKEVGKVKKKPKYSPAYSWAILKHCIWRTRRSLPGCLQHLHGSMKLSPSLNVAQKCIAIAFASHYLQGGRVQNRTPKDTGVQCDIYIYISHNIHCFQPSDFSHEFFQ